MHLSHTKKSIEFLEHIVLDGYQVRFDAIASLSDGTKQYRLTTYKNGVATTYEGGLEHTLHAAYKTSMKNVRKSA